MTDVDTRRRGTRFVRLFLVLVAVVASGCGGSSNTSRLRVYDPSGKSKVELGPSDIVASATKIENIDGSDFLVLRLTEGGARNLHRLSRALALRGARVHRAQALAFEVDGVVYSRFTIDYKTIPDGFSARERVFSITNLSARKARQIARELRKG